jgi:uncharacterized YigZ family protein
VIESPVYRIDKPATSRIRVDRSEFIGEVFPVAGNDEIDSILQQTRKRYPDARHQPYGYRIFASGDIVHYCSDDGEPAGTAGRPIQERLHERNVVNALLVVSRFFGGRKLGTRRLRQAFSESAGRALEAATRIEVCAVRSVVVSFPFGMTGAVNSIVQKTGGTIERQQYDEGIRMVILFRGEIASSAVRHLTDIIQNQGRVELKEGEKLVDA